MKIAGSSKVLALASISYPDPVCDFDPLLSLSFSSSYDKESIILRICESYEIERGDI